MRLTDGNSDALQIINRVHREIKEIQKDLDELEYLLYKKDERCKIQFFGRGNDDKRGSKEGTKAD